MGSGFTTAASVTLKKNEGQLIGTGSRMPQRRRLPDWESWEKVRTAWPYQLNTGNENDVHSWQFNIWLRTFDEYITLTMIVLLRFDLPTKFRIEIGDWVAFMIEVERLMTVHVNPYHNFTHIIDVLQTVCVIVGQYGGSPWLSDLDIYALILSAIVHDLEHPGTNNVFQINSSSPLAIRYNDIAVLESYHAAKAFEVFQQLDQRIFAGLSVDQRKYLRKIVISSVLSTDMTTHFALKDELDALVAKFFSDQSKFPIGSDGKREQIGEKERLTLMKSILHIADISNPAKPWALSKKWSDLVVEEFFAQGDLEKQHNLPVSMNCDRLTTNQDELSINFIDFIVAPFFFSLVKLLPGMLEACQCLEYNRSTWNTLLSQRLSSVRAAAGDGSKVDDVVGKWELRAAAFTEKMRVIQREATATQEEGKEEGEGKTGSE